jgi:hypothetical protein
MGSTMKLVLQAIAIGAMLLVAGIGVWRLGAGTASGQSAVTSVDPALPTVSVGDTFDVRIMVEDVTDLASYEWQLAFDPKVLKVENVANASFLGRTGRTVSCQAPIIGPAFATGADGEEVLVLPEGNVRFGCATLGGEAAPSGSGALARLTFSALAGGTSDLDLVWVQLADALAEDIATQRQGGCAAVGEGATCAAPTVSPPAFPTPVATLPSEGTPAEGTPTATTMPATPTGPTATPTPLPPGWEALPLLTGCQFQTWTGSDGTPPSELEKVIGPAGNLNSAWAMQPPPVWKGYSPEFPEVSDLEPVGLLDVLAICMRGPGAFARPIV